MSRRNRKGALKKSQVQLQRYKNFISSSSYSPEGTIPSSNEMLVGSDEVFSSGYEAEIHAKEDIKKKPMKYKFSDWIKANVFPTIIVTAVIAIGSVVIAHKVEIAVVVQRIDYIEKRIEMIDDEDVERDYLQLQLDLIRTEMSNNTNNSLTEINWRIREIETRLADLEKDKE